MYDKTFGCSRRLPIAEINGISSEEKNDFILSTSGENSNRPYYIRQRIHFKIVNSFRLLNLKLIFGKYVASQRYHGLLRFILVIAYLHTIRFNACR